MTLPKIDMTLRNNWHVETKLIYFLEKSFLILSDGSEMMLQESGPHQQCFTDISGSIKL